MQKKSPQLSWSDFFSALAGFIMRPQAVSQISAIGELYRSHVYCQEFCLKSSIRGFIDIAEF
jgi:hypothetical protein